MSAAVEVDRTRIKEIVCRVFELDPDEVDETTEFTEEMGVESLAVVELLTVLEADFAIEIDDDSVSRMVNLEAIHEVVSEAVSEAVGRSAR